MTRLFHCSDLHFGREDKQALDWFRACVNECRPDGVVVTGDLTMRARSREFAAASRWLGELPVPVCLDAGNHDLPYFNPVERLFDPYRRFRALAAAVAKPLNFMDCRIIPLKTTMRAQWRWNWSYGKVSSAALSRCLTEMANNDDRRLKIITTHHPLIEPDDSRVALTRSGPAALNALISAGADVVLSGHVHEPFDHIIKGEHGQIRVIGAGTLSERLRRHPPSYNDIRIDGGRLEVDVRLFEA